FGGATPARLGLSLAKAARKTGRMSPPLAAAFGRSLREAVTYKNADGLVRHAGDVGRVQAKSGSQAALDALKLAQEPRDLARFARLAEAKGTKTRAILKVAGRAAIVLTVAAFELASSLFAVLLAAVGFCAAVKGAAERLTRSAIRMGRRRGRRLRPQRRALATARPPV
ncbi:MAG TPA: hypothetical protein VIH40_07870, partial [Xanthobacteraceae bacterium]